MTRIAEKKEAYKSIIFISDNRNKNIQTENVTDIATPKCQLSIISLAKEDLVQVYFKTMHRLVCFHFQGERVPNQ